MKAIVCSEFGPTENLIWKDVERHEIGPTQVRIAVKIASLGFMDVLMAQGGYQLKPQLPYTPGACGAGEILEVGAQVTEFSPGDRVSFLNYFGAFAEELVTESHALVSIPDLLSFEQAATLRLTYSPAYFALVERAQLRSGETLLVTGAAGGVGMAAIRLAKAFGANVIAAVGNDAKREAVLRAGADYVVNYSTEDLRDRVKDLTDGRGADVILDVVGGDVFDQCVRCVNLLGRVIVMGFTSGRIPTLSMNYPLLKNCSIVGVFFGGWGMGKNFAAVKELNQKIVALAVAGKISVEIAHRFKFEDAPAAMTLLLDRATIGKIVLVAD
jgi:NADPH2:quinone reductase